MSQPPKQQKKRPFFLNLNNPTQKPDTRPGASFWDDADVPLSPRTPRTPKTPTGPAFPPLPVTPTTPTFRGAKFNLTPSTCVPSKTPTRSTFPPSPTSPALGLTSAAPTVTSPSFGPSSKPTSPKFPFPSSSTELRRRESWICRDPSVFVWIPEEQSASTPGSLPLHQLNSQVDSGTHSPLTSGHIDAQPLDGSNVAPPITPPSAGRLSLRAGKVIGMNIWRSSRSKCKSLLPGKGSNDKEREAALEKSSPASARGRSTKAKRKEYGYGRRSSSAGPAGTGMGREGSVFSPSFPSLQSPKLPEFLPLQPLTLSLTDMSISSPESSPPSTPTSSSMASSFGPSAPSVASSSPPDSPPRKSKCTTKYPRVPSSVGPSSAPIRATSKFPPLPMPPLSSAPATSSSFQLPSQPCSPTTSRPPSLAPTVSSLSASVFALPPPRKSSLRAFPLSDSRPSSCASRSSLSVSLRSSISSISGQPVTIASASLIQLFPTPPPQILSFDPQSHGLPSPLPPRKKRSSKTSRRLSRNEAPNPPPSDPPSWPLPPIPSPKAFVLAPAPKGKKACSKEAPVAAIRKSEDDDDSDVDPTRYAKPSMRRFSGVGVRRGRQMNGPRREREGRMVPTMPLVL